MKKIVSLLMLFIGLFAYSQIPTPFRSGVVTSLSSDPVGGVEGWLFYNTTENVYKYYNGTEWVDVGADNSNFVTLDGTNIFSGVNTFTNGISVLNGVTISSGGLTMAGTLNAGSSVANFQGVRVDLDPYAVSWATDDGVPTKQDLYTKIESLNNFSGDYNDLSNLPTIPDNTDYVDLTTSQTIGGSKVFTNNATFNDGLLFKQNLVFQDSGNERTLTFGSGVTNYTLDLPDLSFGTYTVAVEADASGFNGNLTTSDNTLQEIAQALDDLVVTPSSDLVTTNTTQTISGAKTFSNTVDFTVSPDFNNVRLTNVGTPTALNDATTKTYVDSNFIPNTTTDYVDVSTSQTVGGSKTFSNNLKTNGDMLVGGDIVFQQSGFEHTIDAGTLSSNVTYTLPGATGTLLTDAPSDGNDYVRNNGAWVVSSGGGSGDVTEAGDNTFTGTNTFEASTSFEDTVDFSGEQITGVRDPLNATEPVNLQYFNANLPSNDISTVIVTDSTYTFLEADLLDSKPHIFTNAIADTIEVTIPDVTKADSNLILASLRATNDIPIKIIPSDSANQYQYVIKNNDESVNIASYIENEWFSWRNATSSVYTSAPVVTNLIINETFDNSSDVTFGADFSITGGEVVYTHTSGSAEFIWDMNTNFTGSTDYTLNLDVNDTAGTARFRLFVDDGGWTSVTSNTTYPNGTAVITFTTPAGATGNQLRLVTSTAATSFDFDNAILTAD